MNKKQIPTIKIMPSFKIVTIVNGVQTERKMGPVSLKKAYTQERYRLGNGYDACKEEEWRLFIGDVDEGGFRVRTHHQTNNWSIAHSRIENYRGVGIGQWIYSALAEYYGILESDPFGSTSTDAARVWEKLGATKIDGKRWRLTSKSLQKKKVAKKVKAKKAIKKGKK